jgi:WD40 repeat protein
MAKSTISAKHSVVLCLTLFTFASALCLAQKPELVVQTGHSVAINSIALSADGKTLASGSHDNTIKLWEVATGRELRTLTGHAGAVNSVALSADGKTLASGNGDNTIKLWEVATGRELRTLAGHSREVNSVAFSADGKTLASGSGDQTIKLWEVATGRELRTLVGHSSFVHSVAFGADGQTLASGSWDQTIRLWEVATGRELRTLVGHSSLVQSVAFSADGKTLASGSWDKTIKLWEVATGRELRTLTGHSGLVYSVAISADGKTLASGSHDNTIKLWEVATGRLLRTLTGHSSWVNSVVFSADAMTLVSAGADTTIKLWEVATGRELRTLTGHSSLVVSVAFSADGKTLASAGWDKTIKLWEVATGRELRTLTGHSSWIKSVAFSAGGKTLASASWDKTIKLWEVATGRELRTLSDSSNGGPVALSADGETLATGRATIKLSAVVTGRELRMLAGHPEEVISVAFSGDGKTLASGSVDKTIKLWEVATGREVRTLTGHSNWVTSVTFSADGMTLASGSMDKTIKLWEVATGRELRTLRDSSGVGSIALSADGQTLASTSWDKTIKLWEVATGRELRTLTGHSSLVNSVAFSADGKFLVSGSVDATVKLWRVGSGELLASLIALDKADWAVVAPNGLFDASPGAQKLMHWMVGSEPVDLQQLKERYYEPGLLSKIFQGRPLRDVSKFENPRLYPEVKYQAPASGSSLLTVRLTNRGGGIGRVQIFINGKEFLADARGFKLRHNPNVKEAMLNIDLAKASSRVTGRENQIRVVAWNVENYISSRGDDGVWAAGGSANKAPPEVYAIVGGISQYAGAKLNLNFAAKDAVDIANVIELGAKRLFGADKVHLALLSTANDRRAIAPTKENFTQAFTKARQARPTDILIVYLAGHGITLQRGTDTYCYLTQEARTTDTAVLSDPEVRKQETITSEELVEWIKEIPALKQAVMLDTCAAGAAEGQLKLVDKREASGDAIRAIDRAKDRTGSHILMGSAADAVSYETSQYGQGLLTYALLKGMKGPALSNDEFVDISKLFRFAREEVELLAQNIGGIQKPIIFAPKDETFDVGQLKIEDKEKIVLATPKPMILRPRFYEDQVGDDTLDLMKTLRALLRDESYVTARGAGEAALVFVDDEEFPGGIRPTGIYIVQGDMVSVTLRLRREGKDIATKQVTGTKGNVAAKLVQTIKATVSKL